MPEHRKNESREEWNKRCIPYVIKKEGLSQKQARGKCNGMYDTWKKKQHSLICNTVRNLVDAIETELPRIKRLVKDQRIQLSDFEYMKYNGCEIIP